MTKSQRKVAISVAELQAIKLALLNPRHTGLVLIARKIADDKIEEAKSS